jgi:hypothetical protein
MCLMQNHMGTIIKHIMSLLFFQTIRIINEILNNHIILNILGISFKLFFIKNKLFMQFKTVTIHFYLPICKN